MRLINVEDSVQGHGRKVALIALNINELELLHSFASKLKKDIPNNGTFQRIYGVSSQMTKDLGKAIGALEKAGVRKAEKVYPLDNTGVK